MKPYIEKLNETPSPFISEVLPLKTNTTLHLKKKEFVGKR